MQFTNLTFDEVLPHNDPYQSRRRIYEVDVPDEVNANPPNEK